MPILELDSPSTMTHWFQDEAWKRFRHAETREPHPPEEMHSASAKGPIQMWACAEPNCGLYTYTYTKPHTPPVCEGGAWWSFLTHGANYNPKIHRSPGVL